jgi:hypothetical protein
MADLVVSVTSSLANDLFGSLNYPFRMRVEGNALSDKAVADRAGEVSIDWLAPSAPDEGFAADLEPLLDGAINAYLDNLSPSPFLAQEQDGEVAAIVQPYAVDEAPSRPAQLAAIKARMGQDSSFGDKLETFLKSRLDAGIDWIEAELSQMPSSAMGNPVTLGSLRVAVRARAKACIRVFGREVCASATSPWIRFEGQQAALFLDVEGTRILGRARVADLDFVMTIRILRWEIKIRIGVTGLVNGQLARQRPLLADFGTVRITVPGVQRVYQPTAVVVPASSTETRVEVDGRFSPA